MYVFPAFDANYKTRQRVFRQCKKCRQRKIKCYREEGATACAHCLKTKSECSFATQLTSTSTAGATSTLPSAPVSTVPSAVATPATTTFISGYNPAVAPPAPVGVAPSIGAQPLPLDATLTPNVFGESSSSQFMDNVDIKSVTPAFLKKHFDFNVSGMSDERGYQYVFHDHPKVVINGKTNDNSYWHESGIHVGYSKTKTENANPPAASGANSRADTKLHRSANNTIRISSSYSSMKCHIKDKRTFAYLVSINAFSLTTGTYALTKQEIRQLIDIYFTKINSVLPIMGESFWEEYHSDVLPSLVLYALLLVISKDCLTEPILVGMFKRNGLLSPDDKGRDKTGKAAPYDDVYLDFVSELENKIRQLMLVLPQLGDYDKMTRLATSMLLSLHFGYDRLGNEQASHDLTDAINLAFSMGIHMKRQLSELGEAKISHLNNLWWTCYVLDRFGALVNSRSIFIKSKDFNIDLPKNVNLLKLTQVARSLENMLVDIYRPFKRDSGKPRNEVYNIDEFQNTEFELCAKEQEESNNEDGVETYIASTVHLITRLVNNVIILTAQKSKFDNRHIPNYIPEAIAYRASQNIIWYMKHPKEKKMMIDIPVIPWCLLLAMAVALKRKAREVLNQDGAEDAPDTQNRGIAPPPFKFELKDYMDVLQLYASKWWVVDEILKLSKEFEDRLEKKRKSNEKTGTVNVSTPAIIEEGNGVDTPALKKQRLSQNPIATPRELPTDFKNWANSPRELRDNSFASSVSSTNPPEQNIETLTPSFENDNIGNIDFNSLSNEFLGNFQMDLFDNGFFIDLPNDLISSKRTTPSDEQPPNLT